MSITVKQLIAKLRKHDPDAIVVWQAHDQSVDEQDGFVNYVEQADESLLRAEGIEKIVVLRP